MEKSTMKKKMVIIAIILVLLILLFPQKETLKDGGTIKYKAILYTITKRHTRAFNELLIDGYYIGTEIELFSFEIYDDVEFVPLESDEAGEEK